LKSWADHSGWGLKISCQDLNFHESYDMRMASFQEINADLEDWEIEKSLGEQPT